MSTDTDGEATSSVPRAVRSARRAEYVAFLCRSPYAVDALRLGFATGTREDYSLRVDRLAGVDVPVWMLDNDFRNPDADRFADRVRDLDPTPRVAVVGDAPDAATADALLEVARGLRHEVETPLRTVVVPKSRSAFDVLASAGEVTLGYPNGYADVHGSEIAPASGWASHDVHILGGSPQRTWSTIRELTGGGAPVEGQASLASFGTRDVRRDEIANIVGLDWNGLYGVALRGERWTAEPPHWVPADELTIRATVRRGLENVRRWWRERGVWPASRPTGLSSWSEAFDPSPDVHPYDQVCATCGTDLVDESLIDERRVLDGGWILGFCSEACADRYDVRGRSVPLDPDAPRTDRRGAVHRPEWQRPE